MKPDPLRTGLDHRGYFPQPRPQRSYLGAGHFWDRCRGFPMQPTKAYSSSFKELVRKR